MTNGIGLSRGSITVADTSGAQPTSTIPIIPTTLCTCPIFHLLCSQSDTAGGKKFRMDYRTYGPRMASVLLCGDELERDGDPTGWPGNQEERRHEQAAEKQKDMSESPEMRRQDQGREKYRRQLECEHGTHDK